MKRKTIVILCMLLLALAALTACGNGEVSIKTQPASVTGSYPEGATFSVDVKNAKNVESYQWYAVDQAGNEFELVGVTEEQLRKCRGTGGKTVDEIKQRLQEMGLSLGMHQINRRGLGFDYIRMESICDAY